METPETPTQHEHKSWKKISAKKVWKTLKHSTKKWHHILGTGGIIAITLGLILLVVIVSYERRFDRLERFRGYQPYSMVPRIIDENWMDDIEENWSKMNAQFRDMERRHEKIIKTIEKAPKVINDGQYTGYRTLNGKTMQYILEVKDALLNGTLLGTDTETLNRLRTELEKTGVTITNTNGNIQFTAPKEKLETIVQIVNK